MPADPSPPRAAAPAAAPPRAAAPGAAASGGADLLADAAPPALAMPATPGRAPAAAPFAAAGRAPASATPAGPSATAPIPAAPFAVAPPAAARPAGLRVEPLLRAASVPAALAVGLALVLSTGRLGHARAWRLALSDLPQLLTGSVGGWPLAGGFALNVLIGTAAMAGGLVLGLPLVLGLLSARRAPRLAARLATGFFRNAPWLVLLFFTLYLLPFSIRLFGQRIEFSPALKAVAGLSLPAAANVAEVVRGAVQSIHSGQWESARSLGYTPGQVYRHVILPQALRRMLPGLVNLYALLVLGSSLASVVGVQEVLTTLRTLLATQNETVIVPFYAVVFALFFLLCFPVSIAARRMERAQRGHAL